MSRYTETNMTITDEQVALKESIHKFCKEVLRPASVELDKIADPEDVIKKDSILWKTLKQAYELGYHTAAIPEELLYRGFLIERLTRLFAGARGASVLAVLTQALIFGSVHFQWGFGGIVVTAIMGAIWGSAFLLCGRNLWIVIIAHSAAHIAMVMQLYFSPPSQ